MNTVTYKNAQHAMSNAGNLSALSLSNLQKQNACRPEHTRPSYLFLRNWQNAVPIILDIESSGFGAGSYPIEVGVVLRSGKSISYLIRPEPEWTHWDAEAEATHGITREQLEREGLPVRYVAHALNELLRNENVYSDAWGFDSSWLSRLFDQAELPQMFRLECLTRLMSEKQLDVWTQTKNQVIEELDLCRHRAEDDAIILQKTFLRSFW